MESLSKEEQTELKSILIHIISETNGISLNDTLKLLLSSGHIIKNNKMKSLVEEFQSLISDFHVDKAQVESILAHPVSQAFFYFFKEFPLHYHEEHIHLTGSLSPAFIFPRIKKLLEGPHREIYEKKIKEVYGVDSLPIESVEDVEKLICLKEGELFLTYLRILYLPKLVLNSRIAHQEASYHMAKDLYDKYNVGSIRLKFTLSRASTKSSDQIPGLEEVTEEDVLLGLYDGFKQFQQEYPEFNFVLSPCFRKEAGFFDAENFKTKKDHLEQQVDSILGMIKKHPFLKGVLCEVDTVGDEKELYRKTHFKELKGGLRKLQYNGFKIRSHHGETWKNLRKGVQSVDNAMNIWHIDTLEHGLSLGINPNYYYHSFYQRIIKLNKEGKTIEKDSHDFFELEDMEWHDNNVKEKIIKGERLNEEEEVSFVKTKFHTAREIEHYQHDVLNRMINKKVSLIALPSSNLKLTGCFPDYKDHPFSWWEKKGVNLGVGTDNYITLNTNFIQEMLLLLYSDADNLKITKLLMITSKEKRRPYLSALLWQMRKQTTIK